MVLKESERAEAIRVSTTIQSILVQISNFLVAFFLQLLNSIPRPLSPSLPIEPPPTPSRKRNRTEEDHVDSKNEIRLPSKMEDKVEFAKEKLKGLATGSVSYLESEKRLLMELKKISRKR